MTDVGAARGRKRKVEVPKNARAEREEADCSRLSLRPPPPDTLYSSDAWANAGRGAGRPRGRPRLAPGLASVSRSTQPAGAGAAMEGGGPAELALVLVEENAAALAAPPSASVTAAQVAWVVRYLLQIRY